MNLNTRNIVYSEILQQARSVLWSPTISCHSEVLYRFLIDFIHKFCLISIRIHLDLHVYKYIYLLIYWQVLLPFRNSSPSHLSPTSPTPSLLFPNWNLQRLCTNEAFVKTFHSSADEKSQSLTHSSQFSRCVSLKNTYFEPSHKHFQTSCVTPGSICSKINYNNPKHNNLF